MRHGGWGLRDSQRATRRRRHTRLLRWLLVLIIVAAIAGFSFMQGQERQERRIVALEAQVEDLEQTTATAVEEARQAKAAEAELRGSVEAREAGLRAEIADWKARYESEVPQGEAARIWQLVNERLEAGVPVDRLAEVVEVARATRDCDAEPIDKRIIVRTSLQGGGETAAGFADSRILVTGDGEAGTDANGNAVAWYDPERPVEIHFTRIGGETETVEGVLPIAHSMVMGDSEWRFAVEEGPRNFAVVTAERCAYP